MTPDMSKQRGKTAYNFENIKLTIVFSVIA